MNLHLLHNSDTRRIENQLQILTFWENQMTVIFSKSKIEEVNIDKKNSPNTYLFPNFFQKICTIIELL